MNTYVCEYYMFSISILFKGLFSTFSTVGFFSRYWVVKISDLWKNQGLLILWNQSHLPNLQVSKHLASVHHPGGMVSGRKRSETWCRGKPGSTLESVRREIPQVIDCPQADPPSCTQELLWQSRKLRKSTKVFFL